MAGVLTAIALEAGADALSGAALTGFGAAEALSPLAFELPAALASTGATVGSGIMAAEPVLAAGSTVGTTAGALPASSGLTAAGATPTALANQGATLEQLAATQYPDMVSRQALSSITPPLQTPPNPFLQGLKDAGAYVKDFVKENPLPSAIMGYGIMKGSGMMGPNSTSFGTPGTPTDPTMNNMVLSPNFQGSHPLPPTPYTPVYTNYRTTPQMMTPAQGGIMRSYAQGGTVGYATGDEVETPSTLAPTTAQNQAKFEKYLAAMNPTATTATTASKNDLPMGKGVYTDAKETANIDPWTLAKTRIANINKTTNYATTANMSAQPLGQINTMPVAMQQQQAQPPAQQTINAAHGGIMQSYALGGDIYGLGGYAAGGSSHLLSGPGDGVSDDIPAQIGERQPARLADGEFVIPARIVSELGNGSTSAGAKRLHKMMDNVQADRNKTTGKGNVAVDSKAYKHLPA
jgi:hypothetical protein